MAKKELNRVAEEIVAVLEARHHPDYVAEKRRALVGLDKADALIWSTLKLDDANLSSLAARLGVDVQELGAASRVLRAICQTP